MNRSINVPFDELRFPSSVLIQELVGCGDPGVPVHGYKTGENYWAGQMVTFTCDTGYHLEGPTNRLCLEGGNWSDVMPTCECSYSNSFTPIGMMMMILMIMMATMMVLVMVVMMMMLMMVVMMMMMMMMMYFDFLSSGHRYCDKPNPLENGYIVGTEFWEGKHVTYKCNKGYRARGQMVRFCNETGNWTEEEPKCEGQHIFISPYKLPSFLIRERLNILYPHILSS